MEYNNCNLLAVQIDYITAGRALAASYIKLSVGQIEQT
jgi:hypothetical protein